MAWEVEASLEKGPGKAKACPKTRHFGKVNRTPFLCSILEPVGICML